MMIVFFDIRGIVHVDWVPEGQTVNQVYYKEVLTNNCTISYKKSTSLEEHAHSFTALTFIQGFHKWIVEC
jgi:hypothetical protein